MTVIACVLDVVAGAVDLFFSLMVLFVGLFGYFVWVYQIFRIFRVREIPVPLGIKVSFF
ncbi:hypothetical protein AB4142_02625 [Variovorax sp. 2RAF20]